MGLDLEGFTPALYAHIPVEFWSKWWGRLLHIPSNKTDGKWEGWWSESHELCQCLLCITLCFSSHWLDFILQRSGLLVCPSELILTAQNGHEMVWGRTHWNSLPRESLIAVRRQFPSFPYIWKYFSMCYLHKEGWVPKNWCFRIVVLEKTLKSPLHYKEIKPVNPKGNQPWLFTERTDVEAEAPILWSPHMKSWLIGKDWC